MTITGVLFIVVATPLVCMYLFADMLDQLWVTSDSTPKELPPVPALFDIGHVPEVEVHPPYRIYAGENRLNRLNYGEKS